MKHHFLNLHQHTRAMLAACAGSLCFATGDIIQKLLSENYDPMQVGTWVMVFALGFYLLFMAARGHLMEFTTTRGWKFYFWRALFMALSYIAFLIAIRSLPMTIIYTMAFTMPIMLTLMGIVFLKEMPTRRAIYVMAIGFLGVIIALRPGEWQLSFAMLCAIANGVFIACSLLAIRYFPPGDHWMVKSAAPLVIELGLFVLVALIMGQDLSLPAPRHIAYFLFIGLFVAVGLVLIPYAYANGPIAKIAPFQYTSLIWGTLYGWLFFGQLIDIWTALGAALIIASGLWLLLHRPQISPKNDG